MTAFHLEERRAWVRTGTHTVIRDLDPEFCRFAGNRTGVIARTIRVWHRDSRASAIRGYLGSVCFGPGGCRTHDVRRLFRRAAACRIDRTELKRILRKYDATAATGS